jgi:GT2 family glycosyltransferase
MPGQLLTDDYFLYFEDLEWGLRAALTTPAQLDRSAIAALRI